MGEQKRFLFPYDRSLSHALVFVSFGSQLPISAILTLLLPPAFAPATLGAGARGGGLALLSFLLPKKFCKNFFQSCTVIDATFDTVELKFLQ